jgi:hypothetical protein
MESQTLIDYAYPMMRIEKLLKDMHNDLLEGDMTEAQHKANILIAETKILLNTLVIMQEKESQHAIRQQAPTLQERVSATEGAG